ncbi:MAG TPA: prolipoprotein diacylglyceryl transferase [Rhizomicrobium sp.]|nr:prolipoprotein diacylglyceryl transferase [Rhizomicrobium sp.]
MLLATLPYPDFDPVLVHIFGPFSIRWYAISYIAGLMAAWWYLARASREVDLWKNPPFRGKAPATADQIGDFFVWATLGVIIGGRLGFVLIYGTFFCGIWGTSPACHGLPMAYLNDPIEIFAAWKGGMSFHGGLLGVAIALILFARKHKLDTIALADFIATIAPIGLFFGRIANFINGELWGKATDAPWAMVFCTENIEKANGYCPAGLTPRHPSQLYEAALEGVLLLVILQICVRVFRMQERPGLLTGIFLTGYGLARATAELFRDSDTVYFGWFSVGMSLSLPMWAAAAYFFWVAFKRKPA